MSKRLRFKSVVEKHFAVLRPIKVPSDIPGVVVLDRGRESSSAEVRTYYQRRGIAIHYRAPTMFHHKKETEHAKAKAKKARS